MTKTIRNISILLIIFSFFINIYGVVSATEVNMNLTDYSPTENITDETDDTNDNDNADLSSEEGDILSPSGINSLEDDGLSFSNILSILLITVGIILILLAIAIIFRLK